MDRTLFMNRMGFGNLFWIGAGFGLALAIMIGRDGMEDASFLFMVVGGLLVLSLLILWLVIALGMRDQIAELVRRGDVLEAEMVHILGNGRRLRIPVPSAQNWRWTIHRTARPGGRSATIRFDALGRSFSMPLHGAKVIDVEGLRALAPAVAGELFPEVSYVQA